ncbi:hypothetical protein OE88DRAFT_1659639 [Heliocybe sulcata]|uniref:Protein kinase domain-containing protein n=1 Tax=Heliocybe sulcata TaxID=5364 RepID=A0A5C3N515_9AGAM|nr:hypothetical protein OE88DRAFT_1659639 [Heliocybe sulcata]
MRGMHQISPRETTSTIDSEKWKRISHPNVACPIGFAHWDSQVYMVTALTANSSAEEYLARYPQINRLGLIADVASGLDYLHRHNVIHGDLRAVVGSPRLRWI